MFRRAGTPLTYLGKASGGANNVDDYVFFPGAGTVGRTGSLEVEVLPVTKSPRAAVKLAGYHVDSRGRIVRPAAVVANVIVTIYPGATPRLRRRARAAIAALRLLH